MRSNRLAMGVALAALATAGFYLEGGARLLAPLKLADRLNLRSADKPALPPVAPPITVTIARAGPHDFTETVLVTGSLVAREEFLVAPEIEGLRVAEIRVEEGTRVRKGDVLATLVDSTLQAQLAEKEAALARAGAAIAQARSQIVQAEAKLKEARAAWERAKPLGASGVMAEATLDQRESAARTADAQLVAARDGLKLAEAEQGQAEAVRREILWKLSRTEVKAPVDGLVSRRSARIGAIASGVSEPLFRIISNGEVELDAEVTDAQIARIKLGQTVRVEPAGAPEVKGSVRLISPEVDKATRLGRVRVFIGDNPDLHVGGFARGRIETASGMGLAVPAAAVANGRDGATVQLVRDNRILTRRVETGLASGDLVEIKSGLADGDTVVARAGSFLRDGDSVRPVPAPDRLSEGAGATISEAR
jgi:HlyD family secretion protein